MMASTDVKTIPIYVMDAFTSGKNERYTGNSAAVCFLEFDDDISDETKQKIATTMNLSETTFVSREWNRCKNNEPTAPAVSSTATQNGTQDGGTTINRKIRWFTPAREIELCGHATFASVHALTKKEDIFSSQKQNGRDDGLGRIIFDSKFSGKLTAIVEKDGADEDEPLITLNFPVAYVVPVAVSECLDWLPKLEPVLLGPQFPKGVVQDMEFCPALKYLLLRLRRQDGETGFQTIRKIVPNFQQLATVETGHLHVGAFIVTIENDLPFANFGANEEVKGHSEKNPVFYSRVFAPYYGVTEDPVCGSAHTLLVPFWVNQLGLKEGKRIWAHQASDRSGDLGCLLIGDRVELSGRGQVILQGELRI